MTSPSPGPNLRASLHASLRPWLARHALALAVAVSLPLILLTMDLLVKGLTPGGPRAICNVPTHPSDIHDVAAVVAYAGKLAGGFVEQPLLFEWHLPDDADPPRRTTLELAAADMKARYAFALPLALLFLVSVPVGITAFMTLRRSSLAWAAGGLGLAVIGAYESYRYEDSHPARLFVAEYLLGRVALGADNEGAYPLLTPETWVLAFGAVDYATVLAVSASALIFVVFARLAVADPGGAGGKDRIKRRARVFKLMLTLGSLLLILAVATAHELMDWSSALLAPDSRAAVAQIASSAGLYWGALYSLILAGMAIPAAIAIRLDLHRLAEEPDAPPIAKLGEETGFELDLRQGFATMITLAGPVLTGPAIELLKLTAESG